MGDSEDEELSAKFQLTSFLFGNIDESGELENDVLDNESKRHLSSLGRLGLGRLLNELIDGEVVGNRSIGDSGSDDGGDPKSMSENNINHDYDSTNYDIKSPSAIDYSDISELAEEIVYDAREISRRMEDGTDYDADDEEPPYKSDTQLMPPPPPLFEYERDGNTHEPDSDGKKKKLETPLAAMLPSKYADVDVRELFPDFRVGKVKLNLLFVSKSKSLKNFIVV